MGWTGRYDTRPAHVIVTEELETGGRWKVVARSGRYYAISDTAKTIAVVALVDRDHDYIMTKLVDEDMGPCERACPPSILDLLTPTTSTYASEWRADCRAHAAAKKAMPKVKVGHIIKFDEPIKFTSGLEVDVLRFEGRFKFHTLQGYPVRLPKDWKTRYTWKIQADG